MQGSHLVHQQEMLFHSILNIRMDYPIGTNMRITSKGSGQGTDISIAIVRMTTATVIGIQTQNPTTLMNLLTSQTLPSHRVSSKRMKSTCTSMTCRTSTRRTGREGINHILIGRIRHAMMSMTSTSNRLLTLRTMTFSIHRHLNHTGGMDI